MGVTNKALNALNGLPFDNLIGGPLNACVKAQADAAQTTINFIQEIGLNTTTDENGNEKHEAVYVYFNFIQGGRKAVISVPLLTIVPIPYIAINTIDINFKASVNGVESSSRSNEVSSDENKNVKTNKRVGGILNKKTTSMTTNLSTKKDSKSTQDSSYSIEATIDVAVHASQDSMPAGMSRLLEMLGSAIDLCDPNGELSVNESRFYIDSKAKEQATLVAQYKTPNGVFDPTAIKIEGKEGETDESAGTVTYMLDKGEYTVTAGTRKVKVVVSEVAA